MIPRYLTSPTSLRLIPRKVASRRRRRSVPHGRRCRPVRSAFKATESPPPWTQQRLKHVLEAQQFSKESLQTIFQTAKQMESIKRNSIEARQLEGYIMATLFYEPSTRTRLSFESAMTRLGGTVLTTESAGEYSSAAKGETLEGSSLCQ